MRELGGRWATTLDVLERGAGTVVRETVPETEALYVSIDLDVLDSSIAPGHSLQEPGGLSYRQLARDLGRGGATRSRDRLRRRRAESGARPVRNDSASGHLDRHALSQRDLRSATLKSVSLDLARALSSRNARLVVGPTDGLRRSGRSRPATTPGADDVLEIVPLEQCDRSLRALLLSSRVRFVVVRVREPPGSGSACSILGPGKHESVWAAALGAASSSVVATISEMTGRSSRSGSLLRGRRDSCFDLVRCLQLPRPRGRSIARGCQERLASTSKPVS